MKKNKKTFKKPEQPRDANGRFASRDGNGVRIGVMRVKRVKFGNPGDGCMRVLTRDLIPLSSVLFVKRVKPQKTVKATGKVKNPVPAKTPPARPLDSQFDALRALALRLRKERDESVRREATAMNTIMFLTGLLVGRVSSGREQTLLDVLRK